MERFAAVAEELATEDDLDIQALSRCVRAKILAREGEFAAAETLVREALELLAPTDALLFKFSALLDLAEVYRLAERWPEARAALDEARDLVQPKGSPTMIRIVDEALNRVREHSLA
jgi:Flp pilus assembly protein TadD